MLFNLFQVFSHVSHELVKSYILLTNLVVGKLIPFLRSSVWITTGFGAKYAGPGGTNFKCTFKFDGIYLIAAKMF